MQSGGIYFYMQYIDTLVAKSFQFLKTGWIGGGEIMNVYMHYAYRV